nr:unnamed protein product [Callosobruchus chinensis]
MTETGIKPFLCETFDKSLIRGNWEKWLRSLELYLASEDITSVEKKRNKLLHLGGSHLQEVAYSIPGAIESYNKEENNDVFKTLVDKLTDFFSPKQNSTFERHIFRSIQNEDGEDFNKFLLKIRQQAKRCSFGKSEIEATEISMKDKIIDSWASLDLKKKLLEKERSLDEIIELCQIHEQIGNQSTEMDKGAGVSGTSSSSTVTVNKVGFQRRRQAELCSRCGKPGHSGNIHACPAKDIKCRRCGFQGHYAVCCRSKQLQLKRSRPFTSTDQSRKRFRSGVNFVETEYTEEGNEDNIKSFDCFKIDNTKVIGNQSPPDDLIDCLVGGVRLTFLIDSGSKANIISEKDWKLLDNNNAVAWDIENTPRDILKSYATGKPLTINHRFTTTISIPKEKEIITHFYVVKNGDISLLGKDVAKQLGVLKLGINAATLEKITEFPKIKGIQVRLSVDPYVKPVQQPVRKIPVSVEQQVENKIKEALQKDIIERVVEPSAWISPIVIIFKPNNDIRICVDMRRANEAIQRENYPLPTFDNFMTKLRNAKYFSRLDLESAYHQLELDVDSRPITTFITHKGIFRYKRLMFGVNSAPEIFQRIFEAILAPCQNCLNYLDDIIIYGSTEFEHDRCLNKVLEVLDTHNVLLNKSKCLFKVQELEFLGHRLSNQGIAADQRKVRTIMEFRSPQNKEEVRSFLGLVTYLGKFLPDLGTTTEPLRQLTKKDTIFNWNEYHQQHFDSLKKSLAELPTLSYFDPKRRTQLVADASPVALGAVLLQFDHLQNPKVISFASKSLSEVERRYSQTEKESLSLVWSVERFYFYLAGLEFELVTDHKPLEAIFKPTSKPPARIERWLLRLQAFRFKVVYKPGKFNIADSLSRLCKLQDEKPFDHEEEFHVFTIIEKNTPKAMNISEIVSESKADILIAETINKINNGSWTSNDKNIYSAFKTELSAMGPVLLRGNRIVIPQTLTKRVLELAHEGHPGETVMKRRLRAKVWWPLIDKQTEQFVKACRDCLLVSQPNRPPPMSRHKFPEGPWQCLAIDLMGPLPNKEMVLVLIDYYSRYQEIQFLKTTTSSVIIEYLSQIFVRLGYPKSIRADNGRQFVSSEFKQFCTNSGIELIQTPPYWPQANGEVENANKSILKRLQIAHANNKNYQKEIQKFILMYNVTPHGTTGKSPSQLLFGRNIRDKIPSIDDLVNTDIDEEARDNDMLNKQKGKEKEDRVRKAKPCDIQPGDKVLTLNTTTSNKLESRFLNEEFEVIGRKGNEITIKSNGKIFKRHISHVKKIPSKPNQDPNISLTIPISVQQEEDVITDQTTTEDDANTYQHEEDQVPTAKVEPLRLEKKEGLWRPTLRAQPVEVEATDGGSGPTDADASGCV